MKSNGYQDILDQAIAAEMEAAQFYLDVSRKTDNAFLQDLFLTFSEEEKKHRQLLEGFRNEPSLEISFEKNARFSRIRHRG